MSTLTQYPNITLYDQHGQTCSRDSLLGVWFIVYFYPKDSTSGCTKEAQEFQGLLSQFKTQDTRIIGVSKDSAASHIKFQDKYELTFPLLVDDETLLAQAFGIWVEKSMYGRKYMGVERSTFIFDSEANLRHAWHKVKVPGHAQEVLDTLITLKTS